MHAVFPKSTQFPALITAIDQTDREHSEDCQEAWFRKAENIRLFQLSFCYNKTLTKTNLGRKWLFSLQIHDEGTQSQEFKARSWKQDLKQRPRGGSKGRRTTPYCLAQLPFLHNPDPLPTVGWAPLYPLARKKPLHSLVHRPI